MILFYLGNEERRCHISSAAGEEHVATVRYILLTAEKLKDSIIKHLINDSRLSALGDIFTDAGEVVDEGYVWSVADLHLYLETGLQVRADIISSHYPFQ